MNTRNGHRRLRSAQSAGWHVAQDDSATEAPVPQITVVLADQHAVVRAGLRSMLAAVAEFTIVGEAATVSELTRQALRERPDVVVLGLLLSQERTHRVITDILRSCPGLAVLVFGMDEDDGAVRAAINAGARGYVDKSSTAEGIVRAVAGAAAGWAVFSPGSAEALARITAQPATVQVVAFADLTVREREVLELVAAGLSNAAIAGRLHLASKTVSNYLSAIFLKLGVCDRANAILRAREAGFGVALS
ncbi:response regulator transcription factor [Nocardia brasiliensis]